MQRYFKTLFVTLMPFFMGFAVCYLLGSFISVSFDPAAWDYQLRLMMTLFGLLWGFGLYIKLTWEGLV